MRDLAISKKTHVISFPVFKVGLVPKCVTCFNENVTNLPLLDVSNMLQSQEL